MVYIHIPFCIKKCLYCDFYSVTEKSLIKAYTDALIEEIKTHSGEKTETVYIGGGTPTSIGDELIRIVDAVNDTFVFEKDYEFTVEANPGAVRENLFIELYRRGVNRISLGIQSFNDNELKALGRIHTAEEAKSAVEMIKTAGFANYSVDLMFGIPHQTKESLQYSLDCINKLSPPHVSVYSLILEEGTPFYDMELPLPMKILKEKCTTLSLMSLKKRDLTVMKFQTMQKKVLKAVTIQDIGKTVNTLELEQVLILLKTVSGTKMLLMCAFIYKAAVEK